MSSEEGVEVVPFRISSGLKSLIGRDLITDPFVAIFELVKNSFDAGAKSSDIVFLDDRILIIDDGKGMSRDAVLSRWLFVAYSAKRDGTEDGEEQSESSVEDAAAADGRRTSEQESGSGREQAARRAGYREEIVKRRRYAGSKGVGRFSCDRLGSKLVLYTRAIGEQSVQVVEVDWSHFERDSKAEFVSIPVRLDRRDSFSTEQGTWPSQLEHGTVLQIEGLRSEDRWGVTQLRKLRSALAKLIDPLGGGSGELQFRIRLHHPRSMKRDMELTNGKNPFKSREFAPDVQGKLVNGEIRNFIFRTLREKTTFIDVRITVDGKFETCLTDRGEKVYEVREPASQYESLLGSGFHAQVYFLNRSAKATFTRRMGVEPVNFGSVFLFKNGFRIYPIGERGDDTWGLDARKQQAWGRNLGSRDLLGRIDIRGDDTDFRESTSRDQGLIKTNAYTQLYDCVWEYVFRRLEKYVVDVTFKDKADAEREDISGLVGDEGSSRVTTLVSRLVSSPDMEVVSVSPNLVRLVDEQAGYYSKNLKAVKRIATKLGSDSLLREVEGAEKRYRSAVEAQRRAEQAAAEEARKREQAEQAASQEAEKRREAEDALSEERKRALFLQAVGGQDLETIVNLHHQIGIYAADVSSRVKGMRRQLSSAVGGGVASFEDFLYNVGYRNQQILTISRLATKANFRVAAESVEEDLVAYIGQYASVVSAIYEADGLDVKVEAPVEPMRRRFKPIEVSMLVDNVLSNSKKARASEVTLRFTEDVARGELVVEFIDNGRGLAKMARREPKRIFERGFTTTRGSGLGLAHVAKIVADLGGEVLVEVPESGIGLAVGLRIRR